MDHRKLEEWRKPSGAKDAPSRWCISCCASRFVLVMLAQIFNGNFENVFLCVLTLICS